jgi:hypothetical protein
MKMNIVLTPRQIYAIGHVIAQWSEFDQQIGFRISMWRGHAPKDVRTKRIGREFSYRLAYLRDDLAPHAIRKPEFAKEFARGMAMAANCKGKRDWFAHGTFCLNDNRDEQEVCVTYKWHKFRIATEKVEQLADQIGFLSGWLLNFDSRMDEDVFRALEARLEQ